MSSDELRAAERPFETAQRIATRYTTACDSPSLEGPLAGAIIDLLKSLGHRPDDGEAIDVPKIPKTRRDLRQLCFVLGIPLKEQPT